MLWSSRDPLVGRPHLSDPLSVDSQAVRCGRDARSGPGPARGGRSRDLRQGSRGAGRSLHEGRGLRRSRRSARHTATGLVASVWEHAKRPPLGSPLSGASRRNRTPSAGRTSRGDQPSRRRARRPSKALHPTAATEAFREGRSAALWPRRVTAKRSRTGKGSEDLRMHLTRTIHPGFKEISYASDADDRPQQHR